MRRVDFPEAARGDRILAVTGAEAAYIKGARWVSPAETLFEEALRNAFADGGTCTVLSGGPLTRDGLLLSVDVRRFEADYAAPGADMAAARGAAFQFVIGGLAHPGGVGAGNGASSSGGGLMGVLIGGPGIGRSAPGFRQLGRRFRGTRLLRQHRIGASAIRARCRRARLGRGTRWRCTLGLRGARGHHLRRCGSACSRGRSASGPGARPTHASRPASLAA